MISKSNILCQNDFRSLKIDYGNMIYSLCHTDDDTELSRINVIVNTEPTIRTHKVCDSETIFKLTNQAGLSWST
jgi:hypothetical protein